MARALHIYMASMKFIYSTAADALKPALLTTLLMFGTPMALAKSQSVSHEAWGELLADYVTTAPDGINRVDYAALKESGSDRDALNTYIGQYADLDMQSLSRNEQFAAWVNLYNAVTVRYIVNKYPVSTIKPWYSAGPWKDIEVTADGEQVTLHEIEHEILRKQWPDDPRLHYAINCASIGCPNLRLEPWRAEGLDDTLDEAARNYVNHPRGVSPQSRGLQVSSIYKWFEDDFGGSEDAVIEHLLTYADDDLAGRIRNKADIRDYEYDWSLNGTGQ